MQRAWSKAGRVRGQIQDIGLVAVTPWHSLTLAEPPISPTSWRWRSVKLASRCRASSWEQQRTRPPDTAHWSAPHRYADTYIRRPPLRADGCSDARQPPLLTLGASRRPAGGQGKSDWPGRVDASGHWTTVGTSVTSRSSARVLTY